MQQDILKLCADSLRTFANDKYDIKLKAAHAHELVAAYLGYSSKNALLADIKYPISNLDQAEIIVMIPDDFIDRRRNNLHGLSTELPDSHRLGEVVYNSLFSDEGLPSSYPRYRDYKTLAIFMVENNDAYQSAFKLFGDIPIQHFVDVESEKDSVLLTVIHAYRTSAGEMLGDGKTTINLPRVAGRIGFGKPRVNVERWSAGARRTLESLGVQS